MAEVLDETEEEFLLRLEEEALAEQAALGSQLPQTVIPSDNVAFTNGANGQIQIDPPADFAPPFNRQMIGDAQYQQEVARARAGSGFIAGYGDTQTYDPAIAEAAQRREQDKLAAQAKRFAAVQGYQQAIKNGNTPAEALSLFGKDMYPGAPGELADLVTRREPLPRVAATAKAAPLPKAVPGAIPPNITLQQRQLERRIAADRAELNRGVKEEEDENGKLVRKAMTPREKLVLTRRIEADELAARELIAPGGRLNPAYNKAVDQAGWRQMQGEWERPTVQATDPAKQVAAPVKADAGEQVVVVRRYSLPKSQLEEALKAGYKLSQ